MASITRRRTASGESRYDVRYRDLSGKVHTVTKRTRKDAERLKSTTEADLARGDWIDPALARVTFREYAEGWRAAQVHRPSTTSQLETHLRLHVYPFMGDTAIGAIRPTDVQTWVKGRGKVLAPATAIVVYRWVSAIFASAVRDDVIRKTPCIGIALPKRERHRQRVVPLEVDEVLAAADAMPERLRATVILAAGAGMRQGEVFGLTVDRLDFLRGFVHIDRQLLTLDRQCQLGPPKTAASVRTVPLPATVRDALASHLAAFPAATDGLVFTLKDGSPVPRSTVSRLWNAAAKAAGCPPATTFHALRHFYASLLIRHGESVKVVQSRLGHASAAETLDTYSHLWPDSDDRTREAVDVVLEAANHGSPRDDRAIEVAPTG